MQVMMMTIRSEIDYQSVDFSDVLYCRWVLDVHWGGALFALPGLLYLADYHRGIHQGGAAALLFCFGFCFFGLFCCVWDIGGGGPEL